MKILWYHFFHYLAIAYHQSSILSCSFLTVKSYCTSFSQKGKLPWNYCGYKREDTLWKLTFWCIYMDPWITYGQQITDNNNRYSGKATEKLREFLDKKIKDTLALWAQSRAQVDPWHGVSNVQLQLPHCILAKNHDVLRMAAIQN